MSVKIKYGDVAPEAKENFVPTSTDKADFVDLTQLNQYNLRVFVLLLVLLLIHQIVKHLMYSTCQKKYHKHWKREESDKGKVLKTATE